MRQEHILRSGIGLPGRVAAGLRGLPWLGIGAALVALAALAAVPLAEPGGYVLYLLSLSLVSAIVAVGLNITNGYLGLLNLAAAGQIALGAYGCAILLLRGVPLALAVAGAAALGAAVAALTFVIFARLGGFFFGLATLAAAEIIRLLIRNLEGVTNGVRGLRGYPKLADTPEATYWILLATLAALLLALSLAVHGPLGLAWRTIRENRVKAAAVGIRVRPLQCAGFVLSGAVMSLGGAFLALLLQYIEPGIAGLKTLVQAVLMVALGGAGTVLGPVIGAGVITLVPELLRVANELRLVIYGAALMVIVLAMPGGILGTWERLRRARRRGRLGEDGEEGEG
jgi:branched-chain amino acid transport system permease protein